MTKLEKLERFLSFWFSPWGAAKGARWESFSRDMDFSDHRAECICTAILEGEDENYVNWSALESFSQC